MRKLGILTVLLLVVALAGPSEARGRGGHGHSGGHHHHRSFHHGRVFIGVAPFFFVGPYWWAYPPPPVVVQPPPVYIQQPEPGYWYYCPSAQAYYPAVPSCPEAWVAVPPVQH
jgi:hypothetical protein